MERLYREILKRDDLVDLREQIYQTLKATYEVNRLNAEEERLAKAQRELKVERANLESLAEIERWARSRTHLEHPASDHVVVVREGPEGPDELLAKAPPGDGEQEAVH